MRFPFLIWAAPLALGAGPAFALSVEERDVAAVTIFHIEDTDSPDDIRARVAERIDSGQRTVLAGSPLTLAKVRPGFVYAWPSTNTIVLDPQAGLGVSGFDAVDGRARDDALSRWVWSDDSFPDAVALERRDPAWVDDIRHITFDIKADTPAQACRLIYRQMSSRLFKDEAPSAEILKSFRKELRRWCQYGNLSVHMAEPAQFTIEPFRASRDPLLTLVSEWALIRLEDAMDPSKTAYRFWSKVVGDGAGMGFSRRDGAAAFYDPARGAIYNLMDVAIHSGWGPIDGREVVSAWPLNSTFPASRNIHAFQCDGPDAFRPEACPVQPLLRKLYPTDSVGNSVNVSRGTSWSFTVDTKLSLSGDTEGKRGASFTLGLVVLSENSGEASVDMPLVRTHSNADTRFYRTTRWTPDVHALFQWIYASPGTASLDMVTHLASTLNPAHEIVWELPLRGNASRPLPYHAIYEVGWNVCVNATHCVDYRRPPDALLPTKARMGWSDGIVVTLPAG